MVAARASPLRRLGSRRVASGSVYDLILYFYKLSKRLPKDVKYGLAQEVRENLTEILDKIVIANNITYKEKILFEGEILIGRIKLKIRILKELNSISLKSYEFISRSLVDISKQISAWRKWAKKGDDIGLKVSEKVRKDNKVYIAE